MVDIRDEIEYEFKGSRHARGIKAALFLVLALSLWETVATILRAPSLVSWENGGYVLVVVGLILSLRGLVREQLDLETVKLLALLSALGLCVYIGVLAGLIWGFPIGGIVTGAMMLSSSTLVLGKNVLRLLWVNIRYRVLTSLLFGTLVLSGALFIKLDGVLGGVLVLVFLLGVMLRGALGDTEDDVLFGILLGVTFGVIGGLVQLLFFLPNQFLYSKWGWGSVALFWMPWLLWVGLLWWDGARRERQAQNPLRGLLELDEASPTTQGHKRGLLARLVPWLSLGWRKSR